MIEFLEILNENFFKFQDLLEYKYVRLLKTRNDLSNLDVAFVEGAISTQREAEKLAEIRKNSKKLVAIGSCAINGAPSNHRNFFDERKLQEISPVLKRFGLNLKVEPLNKFVQVDAIVEGCPILDEKFLQVLSNYLIEFGILKN